MSRVFTTHFYFSLLTGDSYFVVGELARTDAEVIRIAGLLRGTESAVQAVSVSLHLFSNVEVG